MRPGGKSSINLDLGPEGKGRLWGSLSSELQLGRKKEGVIERGGYAGMRSKVRLVSFRRECSSLTVAPTVEDDDVRCTDLGYLAARLPATASEEFGRRDAILCQHSDGRSR